ncbi:hypothetical protein Adt_24145 [Abeliophyllum distichum]|uniref:Uncharacterized protein n=1 Tax=Abeliophyllum distichum TaxID=126358 RepID=A0ABD1SCV6_9LAMI
MLFMVQVRDENVRKKTDVFSVTKLSVDPNIISKYAGMQLASQQESDMYSKIEKTMTEEGKGSSSNDEFITPLKSGCEISDSNNAYEGGSVKRALICDFSSIADKKLRTVIKKENN